MPTQPIVEYHPKQTASQEKLAQVMMTEHLGQGIMGVSEMLNKGISAYQDAKLKQQSKELGAITAASTLLGGPDRLPVETRNKIPGILGIDLPRDDQGNVVITPSAKEVIDRATAKAAEADPINFGRVAAGVQKSAPSPEEIKLDQEKNAATVNAATIGAKADILKADKESADKALDRAQREAANVRDNWTRYHTASAGKEGKADEPSDFWINRKTGDVLSKPAAEISLGPGETLENNFWNPSHRTLKEQNDLNTVNARVKRAETGTDLDKSRKALLEARVQQIGAKDPDGLKFIMDGMRDAQALKKAGGPGADEAISYWTKEWMTKLGKEGDPKDYDWMAKYLPESIQSGIAWLEAKTGRGSETNTAPAQAAPEKPVSSLKGGPPKPGSGPKAKSVDDWLAGK